VSGVTTFGRYVGIDYSGAQTPSFRGGATTKPAQILDPSWGCRVAGRAPG